MRGERTSTARPTWWIGPPLLGWLMVAAALVPAVGNAYLVDAICSDLNLTKDDFTNVQTLKSLSALVVVFIAGQIPSWLGYRKSVLIVAVFFTLGSLAIAAAVNIVVLSVGYALLGAALGSMVVIGVSMINAYVVDKGQRASAFAILGAMGPCVFIFFPLLTGFVVDNGNWRIVPLIWAAIGFALLLCLRLAPARSTTDELGRPELATGFLAGIMLALALGALGSINSSNLLSPKMTVQVLGAVVAGILLVVTYRRSSSPGLSLAPLKEQETRLLLVVAALVAITTSFFWITVGFQYVYQLSLSETSIVMVPVNAMAVLGTVVLARHVMRRYSTYVAGLVALGLQGVGLCFLLLVQPDQPVWVVGVLVGVFGLCNSAFGATIASVIMSGATPSGSGSRSAYKSAAGNLGAILGTIFVSTFTLLVIQIDLLRGLTSAGASEQEANNITTEIVSAPSSMEQLNIYSTYSSSYPVEILHEESLIAGFRANTAVGLFSAIVSALIIWHLLRRQVKMKALVMADTHGVIAEPEK